MRSCRRRYLLRSGGGVQVQWECGTTRDFPDETAVDVAILNDRFADTPHHHHHHRHHG